MKLNGLARKGVLAFLSFVSALGLSEGQARPGGGAERPPQYPGPGAPAPSPRPPAPAPRPPAPSPRPPAPAPRPPAPAPRPPAPRPRPPAPAPRPPAPRPAPPAPRPYPPPVPRPAPRPYPPAPRPYPPAPAPGPMYEYVTISVGRALYDYETLRLNDYFNINYYRGYRLESVEIDAYAYDSTQRVSLVVDGQIEADTYISDRESYATIYPTSYVELGYNTYELGLLVRGYGALQIDRIVLRLSR